MGNIHIPDNGGWNRLTYLLYAFRSQLRKDFLPTIPARLSLTRGSLMVRFGVLVSIKAVLDDIMPQGEVKINSPYPL